MADFRVDQAAGLRRLFGSSQLQVITFTAGCEGVGRSSAVANLAAVLARLGKEVLVIDENSANDDVSLCFGGRAKGDLLHVLNGDCRLGEVMLQPMPGVHVLPAAKAAKKLGRLSRSQQKAFLAALQQLERPVDIILVDASTTHPLGCSPFALASHETVVVLSGSSASITEAYALIKKISHVYARRHFRILVNKVRSYADARSIYENIAEVARQRGIAQLDFAGALPLDDAMRQAGQLQRPLVVTAPDSAAAHALREIAADMMYWQQSESGVGGVEQFLQQLLHLSQQITPTALRAG